MLCNKQTNSLSGNLSKFYFACRGVFGTLSKIYDRAFCKKKKLFSQKNSTTDFTKIEGPEMKFGNRNTAFSR